MHMNCFIGKKIVLLYILVVGASYTHSYKENYYMYTLRKAMRYVTEQRW